LQRACQSGKRHSRGKSLKAKGLEEITADWQFHRPVLRHGLDVTVKLSPRIRDEASSFLYAWRSSCLIFVENRTVADSPANALRWTQRCFMEQ
jgi:hypothetical protein